MKSKDVGILLIALSVIFAWLETAYFGYNWTAKSLEERMCDGVCSLVFISGILFMVPKNKLK